jgi:hypothetical protein
LYYYGDTFEMWNQWWRLPFYILCSVSVLGQYRFVVMNYWLGLLVQLVGYEIQYIVGNAFKDRHAFDGMDTVYANVSGAAAAVATASFLCLLLETVRKSTTVKMLQNNNDEKLSVFGKFMNSSYGCWVHWGRCLGITRGLPRKVARVREKLEELTETQVLSVEEEATLIAGVVESQEFNVWSFLMPAIYQLVPGSKIALFWYAAIFPPTPFVNVVNVTTLDTYEESVVPSAESSYYDLMLISVSLALGLLLGLALVRAVGFALFTISALCRDKRKPDEEIDKIASKNKREYFRRGVTRQSVDDDPSDVGWEREFGTLWENKEDSQLRNRKNGTTVNNESTPEC